MRPLGRRCFCLGLLLSISVLAPTRATHAASASSTFTATTQVMPNCTIDIATAGDPDLGIGIASLVTVTCTMGADINLALDVSSDGQHQPMVNSAAAGQAVSSDSAAPTSAVGGAAMRCCDGCSVAPRGRCSRTYKLAGDTTAGQEGAGSGSLRRPVTATVNF